MIWFTCKQCGKTHGRPETAAGATIFCVCGAGLVVPWESTAAEPAASAPDLGPVLHLDPVTFEAVPAKPPPLQAPPPPSRSRKNVRLGKHDPHFCFNHDDIARHAGCADCGESFCAGCVTTFMGAVLCGPCKNYRVKNMQRPVPASNLSILSVLIAVLASPVALCLLPAGQANLPWWSLLALVPQVLAAVLGIAALRLSEKDTQVGGQSWALAGLCTSCVSAFLILLWLLYTPQQWT